MESNFENQNFMVQNERPQFLSVLCILTWVCCGFMFISAAIGTFRRPTAEQMEENIEQVRAYNTDAAEKMEELFESQNSASYIAGNAIGLVTYGISAFGAAMMWQLKRKGFYVYMAGELLQYLSIFVSGTAQFALTGAMMNMSASLVVTLAIAVMLVFDIIFFAMYGANLKYMKN